MMVIGSWAQQMSDVLVAAGIVYMMRCDSCVAWHQLAVKEGMGFAVQCCAFGLTCSM